MSDFETRVFEAFDKINSRLDGIDARLDSMDDRLKSLEGRMERVEIRLLKVEGLSSSALQQAVDVKGTLATWPDMHYLASAAKFQLEKLNRAMVDIHDIRVRTNEIYGSMATDAEIQGMREELAGFRRQSAAIEVRMGTLEGHLGLVAPDL